jgi:hypothetical protein
MDIKLLPLNDSAYQNKQKAQPVPRNHGPSSPISENKQGVLQNSSKKRQYVQPIMSTTIEVKSCRQNHVTWTPNNCTNKAVFTALVARTAVRIMCARQIGHSIKDSVNISMTTSSTSGKRTLPRTFWTINILLVLLPISWMFFI